MVTELRPSVRFSPPSYATWLVPLTILVVVLSPGPQFGSLLVGLGIGALFVASNVYMMSSVRLRVRGAELHYSQGGSERLIASAGALRVVRVRVRGVAHPHWQIWAGAESAVALVEQAWGEEQLLTLARQLGAEVVTVPDSVSLRDVAERYPGTLPWYAKHTFAAGFVFAIAAIAVLVLLDSI